MQPRLHSVGTVVPPHVLDRRLAVGFALRNFGAEAARLLPVFANSGIERRHACMPPAWFEHPHGWAERSRLYVDHAVALSAQAATAALARAGLSTEEVDAIVAVSTSGVCTPSLDALLMEQMRLRRDVVRVPMFGLGCAGGVMGMARAAALAKADPNARVLLVVVELCALTFRVGDTSKSNLVASALFGDGAAAAIIGCRDSKGEGAAPKLAAWGEHTWAGSLDVMGWRIEDDGLGVQFSRDIPPLVRERFRPALDGWLDGIGLTLGDVDGFALHPGGAKVVTALEDCLDLPRGRLADERAILRDYGNMSAATVLFVLERALARPLPRRTLVSALGPGFSAGFLMLDAA